MQHPQDVARPTRRTDTIQTRAFREDQESNISRKHEQPPSSPYGREGDNVRRDARLRERIRSPDRQEQQSTSTSTTRARVQGPRRKEGLHKIPRPSCGYHKIRRWKNNREKTGGCEHHTQ